MKQVSIFATFLFTISFAQVNDHETLEYHGLLGRVKSTVTIDYLEPDFVETLRVEKRYFNVNGDLVRFEEKQPSYSIRSTDYKYDSLGRLIKYVDTYENLKSGKEEFELRTYQYDTKGRLIEVYQVNDTLSSPWIREIYLYEDGALTWDLLQENGELARRRIHYFNSSGVDTLVKNYYDPDVLFEAERDVYDKNGKLITRSSYKNGELTWRWNYEYQGDSMVYYHIYLADEKSEHVDFDKYDSLGNLILSVYQIRFLSRKNQNRWKHVYDANGNWVELNEYLTPLSTFEDGRWRAVRKKKQVEEKVTYKERVISYYE